MVCEMFASDIFVFVRLPIAIIKQHVYQFQSCRVQLLLLYRRHGHRKNSPDRICAYKCHVGKRVFRQLDELDEFMYEECFQKEFMTNILTVRLMVKIRMAN